MGPVNLHPGALRKLADELLTLTFQISGKMLFLYLDQMNSALQLVEVLLGCTALYIFRALVGCCNQQLQSSNGALVVRLQSKTDSVL